MASSALRCALHLLCWLPLAYLVWGVFSGGLGANPAEALIRSLGDWALRMLCVALAITPLRQWLHWPVLAAFRRMAGLYAFFYASMHWLAYVVFDMGLDVAAIVADIPRRPFILVGTLAWLVLLALAVTSIPALVRRLGGKRWQALHRAVYAVAALAVLHFWWMRAGKNHFGEVWLYGGILATLLLARLVWRWRQNRAKALARAARS